MNILDMGKNTSHRQLYHVHRCMCISNKLRILEFGADVNLTSGVRLQQLRDRIQLLTQNHILESGKAMMWTWSLQPAWFLLSAVQALMENDGVFCGSKEEPRPAGMSRRTLWAEQGPEAGSDLLLKGREEAGLLLTKGCHLISLTLEEHPGRCWGPESGELDSIPGSLTYRLRVLGKISVSLQVHSKLDGRVWTLPCPPLKIKRENLVKKLWESLGTNGCCLFFI